MAKIKKEENDKFYTKIDVSKKILDMFNMSDYDIVIEPSAGDGSFFIQINHPNKIGLDILPENENIIKCDWFDFTISEKYKNILIIGNPPFGRQGSLALKFIKKCDALKADVIAFILPRSFKKDSFKNKIPLHYSLINEFDLEHNSFLLNGKDYDVPSIFQVWKRSNILRDKKILSTKSNYFDFVKKDNSPDFAIRRVGFYAGKLYENFKEKSIESHYFIKVKSLIKLDELKKIIIDIEWEHNNTSGPRSVSKAELIEKIEKGINFLNIK